MVQLKAILVAAFIASAAAQPVDVEISNLASRGDPLIGKATCGIKGKKYTLNPDDNVEGAEQFASWIHKGADGQIDVSGNFKSKLAFTWNSVTFFACNYKKKGGSYITSNLAISVLRQNQLLDSACGNNNAGYERSNDLSIGRTFNGDHFC